MKAGTTRKETRKKSRESIIRSGQAAAAYQAIGWLIKSFNASLMDGCVKMKSRKKV